jgi:sugar/nucleoside kinase (ribokinase family)
LNANKKKKVLVAGELNVDLIGTGLQTFPVLGREILAQEMVLTLGSSSAIMACGLTKLGLPVTFVSKIGKDDFGQYCLDQLKSKKVKTENIIRDLKFRTGMTVSLNFRDDKAQVTYMGAIPHLQYKDIPQKILRQHDHLHISSYFLQEELQNSLPQLFQDVKKVGMTISLDPNSDNKNQWNSGIWKCLEFIDVLMMNETEAINISKAKSTNRALEFFGQKVPTVVIKLGSKGVIAKSRGQVLQLPTYKVKVVDATGAGESFDAGFLFGQLSGLDFRQSLLVGNACGALSTQGVGGTSTQPSWEEVQKYIRTAK